MTIASRRLFMRQAACATACGLLSSPTLAAQAARRRVVIDADTANEIDDLYAIVRALLEPSFNILSLNSAQWATRLSGPDTVLQSQKLNEDILRLMNRQNIPVPMGAEMIMGKPWGGTEPRDSAAAQMIISQARQTPAGEKLTVIGLGAATNLASALKLAPDILPKVAYYVLSGRYYADRKVWDKDEFNLRNDLNAANFLLNADGLELHWMPVNILLDFKFELAELQKRLSPKGGVWDYLVARWLSHSPDAAKRIMWDLALVQAIARPELVKEAKHFTPPENFQREIFVYTEINRQGLLDDWWNVVKKA